MLDHYELHAEILCLLLGCFSGIALIDIESGSFPYALRQFCHLIAVLFIYRRHIQGQQMSQRIYGMVRMPNPGAINIPASIARTQKVIHTQSTVISGLITGAVQQRPVTTINIPVLINGGQLNVLALVFSTDYFQNLVTRRRVPETWVISVIDREGKIIARSHSPLHVVGQTTSPLLIRKAAQTIDGHLRYTPSEGIEVYEAFTRSAMSGWAVSVSAPAEVIDASARKAVITTSLGLLVALSIALGAAALFGRRLANSIGFAARSAKDLGHGKEPEPQRIGVREVDDLHQALRSASMVLAASEAERAALLKSEQATRHIAEQRSKSKDDFGIGISA
jgi:hypothetical protein